MEEGTFINDSATSAPFSPSAAPFCSQASPARSPKWGVILVSRPDAFVMTSVNSCPMRAGGQRLYYRSYKAEAAGHKALVTLVFHHGYGCYCGFYDKGKQKAWRKNVEKVFGWPDDISEHCIIHVYSPAKPLSTSCNEDLNSSQTTGHCRRGASAYLRLMPTALANQSLLNQHTCARMC